MSLKEGSSELPLVKGHDSLYCDIWNREYSRLLVTHGSCRL